MIEAATAASSKPSTSKSPAKDLSCSRRFFSRVWRDDCSGVGLEQFGRDDAIFGDDVGDQGGPGNGSQVVKFDGGQKRAFADPGSGKHTATAAHKVAEDGHDALRPGGRRVQPGKIGGAADDIR